MKWIQSIAIVALSVGVAVPQHAESLPGQWRVRFTVVDGAGQSLPATFVGTLCLAAYPAEYHRPGFYRGEMVFEDSTLAAAPMQVSPAAIAKLHMPPNWWRVVEGWERGDTIGLSVNPNVDHGGFLLRGAIFGDSAAGRWLRPAYARAATGQFEMRRTGAVCANAAT